MIIAAMTSGRRRSVEWLSKERAALRTWYLTFRIQQGRTECGWSRFRGHRRISGEAVAWRHVKSEGTTKSAARTYNLAGRSAQCRDVTPASVPETYPWAGEVTLFYIVIGIMRPCCWVSMF
jgi:hypothetical protein